MARIDYIIHQAIKYVFDHFDVIDSDLIIKLEIAFCCGAKWADDNPISPWISVEKDMPCNHEELIRTPRMSEYVIVMYKSGYIAMERMVKISNGPWKFPGPVTHWMTIPKIAKE